MANRTNKTPEKGEQLLAKLALGYSVAAACKAEKISRSAYYAWRDSDPDFKASADAAIEQGTDHLEDVARKRAIDPEHGSDTLLIFLLKARRPDKYKDRTLNEHTGKDGEPFAIVFRERSDGPQ